MTSFNDISKMPTAMGPMNLVSSEPTRANLNDELRAKAAKIGADAIVKVRYAADRQGLQDRGFLTGEGQAVVWVQSQR